jgi:hypothetical protein
LPVKVQLGADAQLSKTNSAFFGANPAAPPVIYPMEL